MPGGHFLYGFHLPPAVISNLDFAELIGGVF